MKRFICLSCSLLMIASVVCMFFAFPVSAVTGAPGIEIQIYDSTGTILLMDFLGEGESVLVDIGNNVINVSSDGTLESLPVDDIIGLAFVANGSPSWHVDNTYEFTESNVFYLVHPSATSDDSSETGMYHDIYNIIVDAFYGTSEINGAQDLVATVLATCAISLIFLLPFLVVVFVIKLILGR